MSASQLESQPSSAARSRDRSTNPVPVASFVEFQQIFGGLWQPSTLSYALEQFFENGGRRALIVRVVDGARPPTITLPASGAACTFIALNPGSREYLRASVDYDSIGDGEPDRFNLVVQRVRSAASELIEDQEIFRRVSILPDSGRFVIDVLLESRLVRVTGPAPAAVPTGPRAATVAPRLAMRYRIRTAMMAARSRITMSSAPRSREPGCLR